MSNNRMPSTIKYIIGNEAAERFSFYGMRSILVFYMVNYLGMAQPDSKATFHLFVSACYLLPLVGAYLSDHFWGKYKTILILSMGYCLGHLTLAIWPGQTGLYFGLGLIALGAGGIKPCVSAFVGDQFNRTNSHLVKKVYDYFYFSVNFGSFFSTLIIPFMLKKFGPHVAFGIPGILMFIATFVLWLGRKQYTNVIPSKERKASFGKVLIYSLFNFSKRKPGQHLFDVGLSKFGEEPIDGAKAVVRVVKVFAAVSIFWALFDQHGSSWVLQAQKMNLHFLGMQFEASQIQALNPIMVMILIPFFGAGVYPFLEKRGIKVTPLRRMTAGMFITGFSFVLAAIVEHFLVTGTQLNVGWQFGQYLVITMAEVLVSITGLEFAYTQAPRAMKSTIMSFWLLAVFFGNLITAYVSKINVFEGPNFFWFFAFLMMGVAVLFAISASRYKGKEYLERA